MGSKSKSKSKSKIYPTTRYLESTERGAATFNPQPSTLNQKRDTRNQKPISYASDFDSDPDFDFDNPQPSTDNRQPTTNNRQPPTRNRPPCGCFADLRIKRTERGHSCPRMGSRPTDVCAEAGGVGAWLRPTTDVSVGARSKSVSGSKSKSKIHQKIRYLESREPSTRNLQPTTFNQKPETRNRDHMPPISIAIPISISTTFNR